MDIPVSLHLTGGENSEDVKQAVRRIYLQYD